MEGFGQSDASVCQLNNVKPAFKLYMGNRDPTTTESQSDNVTVPLAQIETHVDDTSQSSAVSQSIRDALFNLLEAEDSKREESRVEDITPSSSLDTLDQTDSSGHQVDSTDHEISYEDVSEEGLCIVGPPNDDKEDKDEDSDCGEDEAFAKAMSKCVEAHSEVKPPVCRTSLSPTKSEPLDFPDVNKAKPIPKIPSLMGSDAPPMSELDRLRQQSAKASMRSKKKQVQFKEIPLVPDDDIVQKPAAQEESPVSIAARLWDPNEIAGKPETSTPIVSSSTCGEESHSGNATDKHHCMESLQDTVKQNQSCESKAKCKNCGCEVETKSKIVYFTVNHNYYA